MGYDPYGGDKHCPTCTCNQERKVLSKMVKGAKKAGLSDREILVGLKPQYRKQAKHMLKKVS